MVWLLRKCVQCGKYSLSLEKCPFCGGEVRVAHPARFSPQDKYAGYRRAMRVELMERGRQGEGDVCQGNS